MQRIAVLAVVLAAWTQVASAVNFNAFTTNDHHVQWSPDSPERLTYASESQADIAALGASGSHTVLVARGFDDTLRARLISGGMDRFASDVLGSHFGVDYDSASKQLRVVSNARHHFELSLATNEKTEFPDLTYLITDVNAAKSPNVVHLAFTSDAPASAPTALYGIDTGLDTLVRFTDLNGSTLETVGPLGIDVNAEGGFDFDEATGIAYAALMPANESQSSFYTIDLHTGAATKVGVIGGGVAIRAFAVPEPASAVLLLVTASICGLLALRCRKN